MGLRPIPPKKEKLHNDDLVSRVVIWIGVFTVTVSSYYSNLWTFFLGLFLAVIGFVVYVWEPFRGEQVLSRGERDAHILELEHELDLHLGGYDHRCTECIPLPPRGRAAVTFAETVPAPLSRTHPRQWELYQQYLLRQQKCKHEHWNQMLSHNGGIVWEHCAECGVRK